MILLFVIAFLLRSIWFFAPIERDEGHFGYSAWLLKNGELKDYNIDNKPIGLYLLYLIPISVHNSIYSVRIFNNLLFFISILILFKLLLNLSEEKSAFFVTLLYIISMNLPMLEGQLAMAESFSNAFLIFILYFLYKSIKEKYFLYYIITFSTTLFLFFIKQQNLIYLFIIPLFGLYFNNNFRFKLSNYFKFKTKYLFMSIIFIILIIFIYFKITNIAFINLISRNYVSVNHIFYAVSQMTLIFLFFIYGIFIMIKKKFFPIFLILILFFSIVSAFFPPAYSHYYQYLILPICFIIFECYKYFNKKIIIILLIIGLIITIYLSSFQFPNYCVKTNFLDWQFQDICSLDDQMRYVNELKQFDKHFIYLYNWDPYLGWLSEKKIVAMQPNCYEFRAEFYRKNTDYLDSVELYLVYDSYINDCDLYEEMKEKTFNLTKYNIDSNVNIYYK